jgi:hypothetical protein
VKIAIVWPARSASSARRRLDVVAHRRVGLVEADRQEAADRFRHAHELAVRQDLGRPPERPGQRADTPSQWRALDHRDLPLSGHCAPMLVEPHQHRAAAGHLDQIDGMAEPRDAHHQRRL